MIAGCKHIGSLCVLPLLGKISPLLFVNTPTPPIILCERCDRHHDVQTPTTSNQDQVVAYENDVRDSLRGILKVRKMKDSVSYSDIGKKAGLDGKRLELFIAYMTTRWPSDKNFITPDYAEEWALRFKQENEWIASDGTGKVLLYDLSRKLDVVVKNYDDGDIRKANTGDEYDR